MTGGKALGSFARVLGLARSHRTWVVLATGAMIVAAAATVFAYNLVRPLYDQVLNPVERDSGAVVDESTSRGLVGVLDRATARASGALEDAVGNSRATLLVLLFAAIVLKNLATLLSRFATARFGLATIRDLRNRCYRSLLEQSQSFFKESSSGAILARLISDIQLIREALAERFADLLLDALTVTALLVYIFSLNFRLALATVVVAPLLLAPVYRFSRALRRRSRESQERTSEMTALLDETLRGIKVVQAFAMEGRLAERFHRATRSQFNAALGARTIQAANAPAMEIVGTAAGLGLVAWAAAEISAGHMTLGDLSAFLVGVYGAYNPIKRLNKFNLSLQQAAVAADRVFEVIDAPVAIVDHAEAMDIENVGAGIELTNVEFSYEDGRPVLHDVSLKIEAGSTVALVGPSGAGKSTIANLIPRFWEVREGAVTIAGIDVRQIRLANLRSMLGLVSQETILFNDTVFANIVAGRTDAEQGAVETAARGAMAHDFIADLPRGYDTSIGESGLKLSGGQRQRLSIARALFKNPPILILDEATSALDSEAERLVQQALDTLMRGRTTLVIAHRLSTVRNADHIVVLDQGRIVEQGDHDSLMAAQGLYRRLVEGNSLV